MTHDFLAKEKKTCLKGALERHKSGCYVWATHPVNMHGTPSNHQTLLRDWEKPAVFSATGLCKTFLRRQRPFWAFTMDSRRELQFCLESVMSGDIASYVTFDHFSHQEAVCGNATGGFSVLALGGRRQLLFPCALLKALESWGRLKTLRSSRSWSLCRAQSLSWKWAGEWCGNQAGDRKHLHQTFAADVYTQHWAAVGCGL